MNAIGHKINTNGIYLATASTQHEPDPELVKDGRLHPSRIREVSVSTGLLTMAGNDEQKPHLSTVGLIAIILLATALYVTYQYGIAAGINIGKETGFQNAQTQQLAEEIRALKVDKAQDQRDAERIKKAQQAVKENQ